MVAYLIADTDIHDHKTYDEYKRQVLPTIAKFGGRFLVRGGPHEILEGHWRPHRIVVIEFPDMGRHQGLVQLARICATTCDASACCIRSYCCRRRNVKTDDVRFWRGRRAEDAECLFLTQSGHRAGRLTLVPAPAKS